MSNICSTTAAAAPGGNHGSLSQAARGQLDRSTTRAGHRTGLVRGLHLAGVLRARARGDLQARVAERRTRRAASPERAATSPRSSVRPTPRSSWSATSDGRGAGVPQHLPPPRQQAGVERLSRPRRPSGICRQFACKYHGWRYDLDGDAAPSCSRRASSSTSTRADYGLVPVHCDVWAGLHLRQPRHASPSSRLREFLGPMITALEGYPFDADDRALRRTAPRSRRTGSSTWTRSRSSTTHPFCTRSSRRRSTRTPRQQAGFEAPHYQIDGPHRLVSTSGIRAWEMDARACASRWRIITRSGLFGPWDEPDLGDDARRRQPRRMRPVGPRFVPALPELRDPDLGPGLVSHVPLLADVVQHAHLRGQRSTSCPRTTPASASRRR